VLFLASLAAVSASAQKQHAAIWTTVQSVTVVPGDSGPVIEIVSSRPLTPTLQTIEGPLRLVIDLPDSNLTTAKKRIPFRNEQIKGIRLDQFQRNPPVTRVVIDLAGPILYTWDALGNRLRIRLRTDQTATAKPASVPAFTSGAQPVAVPFSEGSSGTLVEAGSRVASGASVSAKEETAILRLARGGEVRVCPGTTVSVTTSSSGQDLMLGMSTGSMETHYRLEESSDSVLTPDFRIVLPGPGEFDLAIRADAHGNTCVSSMPGSTSSVIVAELLGNGTYEIKREQQVVFRQGRLDTVDSPEDSCGCPRRQEPVMRASAESGPVLSQEKAGSKLELENSTEPNANGDLPATDPSPNVPDAGPETRPVPHAKPGEMKVQVEAPLVFSGAARAKARPSAPAPPMLQSTALPLTSRQAHPLPAVIVLPPAERKGGNRGFFGRVKGFFGSIFR